jgi:hypothetical protein
LRDLHSPDAPGGVDAFTPDAARVFEISIEVTIGAPGMPGGDLFTLNVVGPDWFAENPPGKGFRWGRSYLIVDRWDPHVVRRAIEDVCLRAEGKDWADVVAKLVGYFRWEFERYRPSAE